MGFAPVFVAGALASLVCLAVMPALPGRTGGTGTMVGVLEGLRTPAQVRPALVFLLTAMGTGIIVTFLPLATQGSGRLAAVALLANTTATMGARWSAGRFGPRHGQARLLIVATVAAALGMGALALTATPAAVAPSATSTRQPAPSLRACSAPARRPRPDPKAPTATRPSTSDPALP